MRSRCRIWCVLVVLALGCGDRKPRASAPAPDAAAPAVAVAAEPIPEPATDTADPWARPVPAEPAPAARGLYRRAVDLAARGDAAGAAALAEQIRREHPDTRFAFRLRDAGSPAASAALLVLVGALLLPVLAR